MATAPSITSITREPPLFSRQGPTLGPAGLVAVQGTADPGTDIVLHEADVFAQPLKTSADGTWFSSFPLTLIPGLNTLVATSYPSGLDGPQGPSSAPVEVNVGTEGADTLAGLVLAGSIAGPRYVFGGTGDDTITAYTVVPDAAGRHASGGAITIDGGLDVIPARIAADLLPHPAPTALGAAGTSQLKCGPVSDLLTDAGPWWAARTP